MSGRHFADKQRQLAQRAMHAGKMSCSLRLSISGKRSSSTEVIFLWRHFLKKINLEHRRILNVYMN